MNVVYQEIRKSDNRELAELMRGILTEYGVNQPGTVFTDPTTDHLFELFQSENSVYFVASYEGELVGGCGLFPTKGLPEKCIELVKFYVKSSFRGKGIGKKLMEMCLHQAKKQRYSSVYLESLPELDKAVGMYEQAGFKHIPERLGNSGHFACNILMLKEL
jgi:putative acetyltransferase